MTSPAERTTPLVFVDTNVFYPVRLTDLVLSCVDDGLLDLCVSDHLLNEIEHVLVERKGLPPAKAKIFRDAIASNAARTVLPADYEASAARLSGPDPDDLWHLADAIEAGATVIVTGNITDFTRARIPDGLVAPQIATPDQLFAKLIADGLHDDVLATVARMSARLKNPPDPGATSSMASPHAGSSHRRRQNQYRFGTDFTRHRPGRVTWWQLPWNIL